MRKNPFKISQSEKNRIKNLHENVKNKPQIDSSLNYTNTIITEAASGGCSKQSMQISCKQGYGWAGAPTCKCQKCKICCQSGTNGSNYQMHEPITVGTGGDPHNPGTCACPEGSTQVPCEGDHGGKQKHCQCCINGQPHSMSATIPWSTPCSSMNGGGTTNCATHSIDGGPKSIDCGDGGRKMKHCQCCINGQPHSMSTQIPFGTDCSQHFGHQCADHEHSGGPAHTTFKETCGGRPNHETCCNCCNNTMQSFPDGCPDEKCWKKAIGGNCIEPCGKGFSGNLDESSRANSYGELIYELPARYGRKRMTESQLVRMVKSVTKRK